MLVGLSWVVLLFHVVLARVTHMAEFIWELIWVLCWVWNVQDDLSHMSGTLVLTVSWSTLVLFHKDYLFLHAVSHLLFSPDGWLPRERH